MAATPQPWVALLAVLALLCVVAFFALKFRRVEEEGFAPIEMGNVLRQVNPMAPGSAADYRALNDAIFREALPNGMFVSGAISSVLPEAALSAALATPDASSDPSGPPPSSRRYRTLFVPDPVEATLLSDEQCRSSLHPANLTRADPSATSGCGWVYSEGAGASFGAWGTAAGPFNAGTLRAGAVWKWDLVEAARLENLKLCKTARSCNAALVASSGTASASRCGFCSAKGWGVPVDASGAARYPGTCDARPLSTPDQCAVVAQVQYQQAVVAAAMNGTTPPVPPGAGPCDAPDTNGFLPAACVIQLAKEGGYAVGGGLVQLLSGSAQPSLVTQGAMRLVAGAMGLAGSTLPRAMYAPATAKLGRDTVYDATALRVELTKLSSSRSGQQPNVMAAAAHLITDATRVDFDACAGYDEKSAPASEVPLACLQRDFRVAGCQPAGSLYPRSEAKRDEAMVALPGVPGSGGEGSYGSLKARYAALAQGLWSAGSGATADNTPALGQCLGVSVPKVPTPAPPCTDPGVEYLQYALPPGGGAVPAANVLSNSAEPLALTLLGRFVTRGGFINVNTSGPILSSGRSESVLLRARAVLRTGGSPLPGGNASAVVTDDGIRVRFVDEGTGAVTKLFEAWWPQGSTRYEFAAALGANSSRRLEVDWYQAGGWSALLMTGAVANSALLFLPRLRTDPFVDVDFTGRAVPAVGPASAPGLDRNRVVVVSRAGPAPTPLPGATTSAGATFNGSTSYTITNPLRLGAFGAVSMRVRLTSMPPGGEPVRLLSFQSQAGGGGAQGWDVFIDSGRRPYCTARSGWANYTAMATQAVALGAWVHLAAVWRAGNRGLDLFVDGVQVAGMTCPALTEAVTVANTLWQGLRGDAAYLHLFDGPVGAAQLREEMGVAAAA